VLFVSPPVLTDPLVACAPLHPPEAVQPVALLELQVKTALPSALTVDSDALRLAVGAGSGALSPPPQAASNSSRTEVNGRETRRMA
jgi:hypothetical protein